MVVRFIWNAYSQSEGGAGGVAGPVMHRAAEELEREHVHRVYSQIAPHFSDTRYKPWPKVAEFLLGLPEWSIVADVG